VTRAAADEGDGERQQADHEGRHRDPAGLHGPREQHVVQDVADKTEPRESPPCAPPERALQPAPGRCDEHDGDEAVSEITSGRQLQRRKIGGQLRREKDESPERAGIDAGRDAEEGVVRDHVVLQIRKAPIVGRGWRDVLARATGFLTGSR
jgi:hypothetical protein